MLEITENKERNVHLQRPVMHKQNRDPTVAGLENSKNVYTQIINIYTIL